MITRARHSVVLAALVGVVLTLGVAGCGKKGSPVRPVGSDFPRQFPNPSAGLPAEPPPPESPPTESPPPEAPLPEAPAPESPPPDPQQ